MIIFLLLAAGIVSLSAYRSLRAALDVLPLIPDSNEDFDFSLVNSEAVPIHADSEPAQDEHVNCTAAQRNIAVAAS